MTFLVTVLSIAVIVLAVRQIMAEAVINKLSEFTVKASNGYEQINEDLTEVETLQEQQADKMEEMEERINKLERRN